MKNIAENIAELYSNDGYCFEREDGANIGDTCTDMASRVDVEAHITKYIFVDGSSVVSYGGAWDLGIPHSDCMCWLGAGHTPECEEGARQ